MTSIKHSNVIAVIVAYQPNILLLRKNIEAVREQVDRLIVVDNSESDLALLNLSEQLCVDYYSNGENLGVAQALNVGLKYANSYSGEWLLTLDQDSVLSKDYVEQLLSEYCNHPNLKIASLAGVPIGMSDRVRHAGSVKYLISSGNLVQTSVLNKIGGFRESFFIDYVDYDVSLKLRRLGFTLFACPNVQFSHNLGNVSKKKLIGIEFSVTNHSAIRRYYMTRNRLIIYRENIDFDPSLVVADLTSMCKEVVKIILAECDRKNKCKAILFGICDFFLDRTGKLTRMF